ncbi:TonB family protein [Chamaesiphon sp.]|uniref:TonB family protein n=1 Tax=Chamaesiphon sp. TaxID=2814140 RepID=UPI0035930D7A
MEQSSLSAISRQNADKNLRAILLAGVGGSIAIHVAAIAGVTHFWKPVAAIEEPMEITMVDVDKTVPSPVITAPAPIVKSAPKITPQLKTAVQIAKTPAKVNLQPKPAPKVVTPAVDKPIPIVKTTASLTTNPAAKPNRPIGKAASKPAIIPKRLSTPTQPVIDPAFPDELFRSQPQPAQANNTPRPQKTAPRPKITNSERVASRSSDNQPGLVGTPSGGGGGLAGKLSNNPNPGGSGGNAGDDRDFGTAIPSKIGAVGGGNGSGAGGTNQSGLAGNSSGGGKLASGFGSGGEGEILTGTGGDGDFGKVTPSRIGATGGGAGGTNQSGLAGNSSGGGKLTRGFGGGSGGGSGGGNGSGSGIGGGGGDGDFGTVTQGNTWRGARGGAGSGLGNPGAGRGGDGGGGVFGLQCIRRCEISGLTDLDDKDGGKDKLRIKIAIDPKGFVTRASISKSSGNSTIDRVIVNGVKQMQFSPPGKTVERVIKANILM